MILVGIFLPFLGTALGAMGVFFLKGTALHKLQQRLAGFAAGVMTAACIWSLLLPAIEQSEYMVVWKFIPATMGFVAGLIFLPALDPSGKSKLVMAVTMHNIPEGMAVGAAFAGVIAGESGMTLTGAMMLAVGITIQNFPEGAIISMPLGAKGMSRGKAFGYGAASGIVEPIGALLTLGAACMILPILPYLLSFSAGAMMYVVIKELLPEGQGKDNNRFDILWFGAGFVLMMAMDVMLG